MTTTSNSEMFAELKETILETISNELNVLRVLGDQIAKRRQSALLDIVSIFTSQESILCYRNQGEGYVELWKRVNHMADILNKDVTNLGVGQDPVADFITELRLLAFTVSPMLNMSYVDNIFNELNIDPEQEHFFSAEASRLLKIIIIIAVAIKTSDIWLQIMMQMNNPGRKERHEKSE